MFALCIKYPGLRCIWTAHLFKTARETFESTQSTAELPGVKPYIANIYRGAGDEKIVFENGSKIMFGARERGFGRGFPNIGVLIFDVAAALTTKLGVNVSHNIGPKEYAGAAQGKWNPGNIDMNWFRGEVAKDMRGEFDPANPPTLPVVLPPPVLPGPANPRTDRQLL